MLIFPRKTNQPVIHIRQIPTRSRASKIYHTVQHHFAVQISRICPCLKLLRNRPLTVPLLSFHPNTDDDTLTANLIFGDGAGAALVEPGDGPGLEIIDWASFLVPGSEHALGFDLTDRGFRAVINRSLADIVAPHTKHAIERLLHRNGLDPCGVDAWLLHPGGARILHKVEAAFGIPKAAMQWSWDSLQEFGNTSSAAIFDVLRRYIDDPVAPRGWGVIAAFGPGVSIELLLVRSR